MRGRSWLELVAVLLGLGLLAQGVWIPAKAIAAQVLLERAWERTRSGEQFARPWPWADHRPVARIRVPRLEVSVIVLEGATGASLAFGPGHLAGSAPPGAPGNAVLAGHRDTHFAFLRELRAGDAVWLDRPHGPSRHYSVKAMSVVHERDLSPLQESEAAALTLITCFPFDATVPGGPERYVVRAESGSEG